MRLLFFLSLSVCALPAQTTPSFDPLPAPSPHYKVEMRLPEGGLFSREEMHIEFRITDSRKEDPLMGFAPVIRATVASRIDMPSMAGMPDITGPAHPEGVPGEYGIHPVFAHGGTYRVRLVVVTAQGETFGFESSVEVGDARPAGARQAQRYKLEVNGQPESLRLRVIGPDGPVTDFDMAHERLLHLIAIRKDYQVFQHLHPEAGPNGVFTLRHKWPAGGDYLIFADVAPRGKGSQMLPAKLKVRGPANFSAQPSPLTATVESLPEAGRTGELRLSLTPKLALEPYLGAMGHLLMISANGDELVHAHPVGDDAGRFLVRLPAPGRYKAWVEVQSAGKVIATPFEVEAKP